MRPRSGRLNCSIKMIMGTWDGGINSVHAEEEDK